VRPRSFRHSPERSDCEAKRPALAHNAGRTSEARRKTGATRNTKEINELQNGELNPEEFEPFGSVHGIEENGPF
jgi:hypothetical protein